MKKLSLSLLVFSLLIGAAGCGHKKKDKKKKKTNKNIASHINIPVADDSIRSFFDDEMGEFALMNEAEGLAKVDTGQDIQEYAWVEEVQAENEDGFKAVYFDFNKYDIKGTESEKVSHNTDQAKKLLVEAEEYGETPMIVVDGHSCHSAGSATYNLALSEKRAKALADKLVADGIPSDKIKIVGRGDEVPAITQGKVVTGDKKAQWPNRRDEVRVIYS